MDLILLQQKVEVKTLMKRAIYLTKQKGEAVQLQNISNNERSDS